MVMLWLINYFDELPYSDVKCRPVHMIAPYKKKVKADLLFAIAFNFSLTFELLTGCTRASVIQKRGPKHPNVNMHILHTVLYTFCKVLTRRICLTIKSFFSW